MIVDNWSPLALSVWIAVWSTLLSLGPGIALAWLFARRTFRGKWLAEGVSMLPLVLPPTVLGYYLLIALGQRGLGPIIEQVSGLRFVFAWPGAVVASAIAALPLIVQTVRPSIADLSREIEDAGRVDGCNEMQLFVNITLPLIRNSLIGATILGFLRALGEFGASLMVAGNIPGRTQTLAMAVYDAVQANEIARANALVALLTAVTFGLLFVALRVGQQKR